MKADIVRRVGACNCGCQGRDPQHRRWFRRDIRNIRKPGESDRYVICALPTTRHHPVTHDRIDEVGEARLPWSDGPVPVIRMNGVWWAVRDVVS